jgi:hypothetical protein
VCQRADGDPVRSSALKSVRVVDVPEGCVSLVTQIVNDTEKKRQPFDF